MNRNVREKATYVPSPRVEIPRIFMKTGIMVHCSKDRENLPSCRNEIL